MQFIIDDSPDTARWPVGTALSLHETVQLLELDTADLLTRSRSVLILHEQGFSFVILRQGQIFSEDVGDSSAFRDPDESDADYGRLMDALEEAQMALERLEERLLKICRAEDRKMAATERMRRDLATLERLCRERWPF